MLPLIIDTTNATQSGLLFSFDSQGIGQEQDFIKGDKKLALMHRPVVPSGLTSRPWTDDWLNTDTFEIAIGNPDTAPIGGTWKLGVQRSATHAITSASLANPTHISCTGHGMATGDVAIWSGMTGSTPDLNNQYFIVTVIDSNTFSVPVNVTVGGTGGTLISFNTNGLTSIAYNVSAATLQSLISTTSTTEGYGSVVVTALLRAGNYQVAWVTPGAVPNLYGSGSSLTPASSAFVAAAIPGDGSKSAVQVIELAQQPVAYCQPATPLPAAAIAASIAQAGAAGPPDVNKVYAVTMTSGTYGGTFSITLTTIATVQTSFIAEGTITAQDLESLLNSASGITAGDITVTRVGYVFNIQFGGTQKASNAPTIAAANIDLIAPLGVTGFMDLNTVNLFIAFESTDSPTLPFTFSIRRTRATGEEAEYFQHSVILKRNLINVATLVQLTLPQYYTQAQIDALLALKANMDSSGNVLVGTEGRFKILSHGFQIEVSADGGSTWQPGPSYVAS